MRIVFMGTPQIAVPCLEALIEAGHEIPLVLSQPDKPAGRGKKMQAPPVKECAEKHGIEVFQPTKLRNNPEALEKLTACNPDFLVVVAYGKILPKEVLDVPKKAPINVHFSLLPKYRGAAPVNWAIINGEEVTGNATMIMDVGLDTGDILEMEELAINGMDAVQLAEELAKLGARMIVSTVANFDQITPRVQDHEAFTYAPIIKKEDGNIDWTRDAVAIEHMVRGFVPWPTAYSTLNGAMVKFFACDVLENNGGNAPGTIFDVTKKSFSVACGTGALKVNELQFEGKKRMPTANFLAGAQLTEGGIFGA